MNLASKYRPHTWDDVVEQPIVVDILKGMCKDEKMTCRNFLLTGPAGCGKAQPEYSLIQTPNGPIRMGDTNVGMKIFDSNGDVTKITGVFPQGYRSVFEIICENNYSFRVADNHLNTIYTVDADGKLNHTVMYTHELIAYRADNIAFVKMGVEHYDRSVNEDIILDVCNTIYYIWDEDIGEDAGVIEYCVAGLQCILESSHTYRRQFIHELISTYEKRTELKSIFMRNRHHELIGLIQKIFESLGLPCNCYYSPYGNEGEDSILCISQISADVFARISPEPKREDGVYLAIKNIRYIGEEKCRCIMVDSPTHEYLTDHNIITHNTTLCRIIADEINGGQGEPIEIDAASYSGVDAMRDIVKQAQLYPIGCDWKVFIIDEAHAITSGGWQVLLKCLESSPAKTIFMFATTNPEKIPATIISRVQTFQLSKISLDGIVSRLKHVIHCENAERETPITYTEDGILFLAKLAHGGMRDALTLLDKALAFNSDITSENLVQSLNLPHYDDFFELLNSIVKKDNEQIIRVIDEVYNSGVNFIRWFNDFHSFLINIVKFIFLQDINSTTIPSFYEDKIVNYNVKHSAVCLKLCNKLIKMNAELKTTPYLQETAITYLCSVGGSK